MNYDLSFINTDCELRSYFLGLWMSDGWLDWVNRICISSSDSQIIEDLVVRLKFTNKITKQRNRKFRSSEYSGTFQYTLAIRHPILTNWMKSLGAVISKTGHEFIPECISSNTFHHFLRGYSDGDGSLFITNHKQANRRYLMWGLTSKEPDILINILSYLRSKSIIAAPGCNPRRYNHKCQLNLGHVDSLRLCKYIYQDATIKLDRKYQVYLLGLSTAPILRHRLWTAAEDMQLLTTGSVDGRSKDAKRARRRKLLVGALPHNLVHERR